MSLRNLSLKNLLLLFAFLLLLLLPTHAALAQQAPQTAPAPQGAPARPPTTDGQNSYSILVDGGNFLGIVPEAVTSETASRYGLREPRGVGVSKVLEGGPAARAGLKAGDVILRFDSEPLTSVRKLNRLIAEAAPGQTVRLSISRQGKEQDLNVTLEQRREFPLTLDLPGDVRGALGNVPNRDSFTFTLGAQRRIGASTIPLTKQLADYFGVTAGRGVLLTDVQEMGAAAKAGLKAGDVITQVDGTAVETSGELTRALNRQTEGAVTLTVIRDKTQHTFRVTPERGRAGQFNFPEGFVNPRIG